MASRLFLEAKSGVISCSIDQMQSGGHTLIKVSTLHLSCRKNTYVSYSYFTQFSIKSEQVVSLLGYVVELKVYLIKNSNKGSQQI